MHNLGKEFHLSDEAGHLADPGEGPVVHSRSM
jgi:hypothetical protein